MHSFTPDRLKQLTQSEDALQLSDEARGRLEWIVRYLANGESVSATCERLGISRSTFHRWLDRFDPENLETLEEKSREPHHLRTVNVSQETRDLIRDYRTKSPHIGKEKIAELLELSHGIELSSSTIGRIIERDCLYFGATPLHWKKRMNQHKTYESVDDARTEIAIVESNIEPAHACACFWCRMRAQKYLRRTVLIGSIVSNVALIALVAATLLWEGKSETLRTAASSTDIQSINTSFSLDNR